MRQTEQHCLACGRIAGAPARVRPVIGAPFAACGTCGGFVPRPSFHEWELMGPATRLACLAPEGALVLALGLLPALAYGFATMAGALARDPLALAWVAALGLGVALAVWLSRVTHEVRRSRRRLGDPMYRAKLVQFELASKAERNRPSAVPRAQGERSS